jgi:hypothetical protein
MTAMWNIHLISSWDELQKLFNSIKTAVLTGPVWWFRGQADADWPLAPSLLRYFSGVPITPDDALRIEDSAVSHFQASAHLHDCHAPRVEDALIAWLAYMQHHHCPTRMLDWTESPFVGLYFAVEQLFERDAALWVFPPCDVEQAMNRKFGSIELSNQFFASHPRDQILFGVRMTKQSARAAAQQAVFTICTDILAAHDVVISEALSNQADAAPFKVIIPARLKLEFLAKLRAMNITAMSLFPGIDGIGKDAAEVVRLRAWHNGEIARAALLGASIPVVECTDNS